MQRKTGKVGFIQFLRNRELGIRNPTTDRAQYYLLDRVEAMSWAFAMAPQAWKKWDGSMNDEQKTLIECFDEEYRFMLRFFEK